LHGEGTENNATKMIELLVKIMYTNTCVHYIPYNIRLKKVKTVLKYSIMKWIIALVVLTIGCNNLSPMLGVIGFVGTFAVSVIIIAAWKTDKKY